MTATIGAALDAPVIVVGAGAAGLAMADTLARHGIAYTVLEKEPRLAEPWRQRHAHLTLNTHRNLSTLPGFKYPAGTVAYPHKDVIVGYLEAFAAERDLTVEFGTAVTRIERGADGNWTVHTSAGPRQASNVIIATGRDRIPWLPDWAGKATFAGRIIHAADFGTAAAFAGKSILVIGAGNSGFDVLNHLARVDTGPMWLAVRSGPAVLPKRIGNIAVNRFGTVMARLPLWLADAVIGATQRFAFGDLRRYGLPRPAQGGATRLQKNQIALSVDEGAVAAIKAGRIKLVGAAERFEGTAVVLADGTRIEPEIVIAATGYRTGLEEMVGALGVLDENGVPKATGAEPTGQKGLWFIGMRPSIISNFHAATQQAGAIVARIQKDARRS
ncbi:flavin-containing monooxygenase [Manganibacter manganicus]|uniref:Dimethylaniline monooxygenase n=1 Tax=Manganibacter manganicus TaxID=1873176 RepID=A0A1V8RNP7_9HYPH|nr:NAD(P)/FAD-dependent oxidoreductase [Pseudaminobacter manganicus]OQM74842.1 dimethylaniline monooxygenase [Pseudaminobacter manganicus]